jgi:hypothetical protein
MHRYCFPDLLMFLVSNIGFIAYAGFKGQGQGFRFIPTSRHDDMKHARYTPLPYFLEAAEILSRKSRNSRRIGRSESTHDLISSTDKSALVLYCEMGT